MRINCYDVPYQNIDTVQQLLSNSSLNEPTPKQKWKKRALQITFLFVVLGLFILALIENKRIGDWLTDLLQWIKQIGIWSIFIIILLYIVCTVLLIPGIVLTLGAGFVFSQLYGTGLGILLGIITVYIGANISAVFSFILARFCLREFVKSKADKYPIFSAIDQAIKEQGVKIIFLLRLTPLIPFNIINYFFGTTGINLINYVNGNQGIIPGVIVYVYLGTTLSSIKDAASGNFDKEWYVLVLIIAGSILALLGVIYVSIIAKKKVKEILLKQNEKNKQEEVKEQFKKLK